ncbi:glycerol-3-phosphate dehydrogenase/oxidase [Castellaniella caeni]|uniref:glycerol-3-phosphate dehydrogenase/oxidase n=1 Tax=Castellaniella caeni TaxID=266123 RepID=UPI000833BB09|nr:glycerol-3-phosphate dehydrogenase/oxidase [Castellaniella caeni]
MNTMSQTAAASPARTDRAQLLHALEALPELDLIVIGGGASGLGVALDARLRGLSVLLLESHDFAGGTSSRATKLVHGGVRYLAQGNIGLVREALHERRALLGNAPHLAQPLAFIMPAYRPWELPFYGMGLKMYDALAGSASLGRTEWLGRAATARQLPGVNPGHLYGGVKYWDGQFDDARLALALARTAAAQGALVLNYCPVIDILHEGGRVCGVRWEDALAPDGAPRQGTVRARCVVNATGVWVDRVRQMDDAARGQGSSAMVAPSQGVHLVVERAFLPSQNALLVPHTRDGRVLFAVPWLGHVILGTTDTPRPDAVREPRALPEEAAFILNESARVLSRAPKASDVRSVWVGLRPLVRPDDSAGGNTKAISREHTVRISPSGLVTVTGGKWTTYRAMAEDVLQHCVRAGQLGPLPSCRTARFPLVGAAPGAAPVSLAALPGPHTYGSEAGLLQALPGADVELGLGLTEAMVRFAARHEYARCVEDVLARRHRMLFLDAGLAATIAPRVARILFEELGVDGQLDAFLSLAAQYGRVPA